MIKVAFIGAGSTVFAKSLMGDILSFPEFNNATFALMDIDAKRLEASQRVAEQLNTQLGTNATIQTTTNREEALRDADYVLCMIQVGGYRPATVTDFEIPAKYGLRQTIGDTLGIGGIMRGLRTIPVLLDIVRDMERLCPDAMFINYVNPMAINQWALSRSSSIKTVGLCHSVPHTAHELAQDLGLSHEQIDYRVAGINHMAFFLKLAHKETGENLYPAVQNVINEGRVPDWNQVRYEVYKYFGYFVTESSEHFSEYVPWFIKADQPALIEQFNIPLDEYLGRCEAQIAAWELADQARATGTRPAQAEIEAALSHINVSSHMLANIAHDVANFDHYERSVEYGSLIIHSIETDTPRTIYGNVPNHGVIQNLPNECCVEVPCLVDSNGIQPTHVGKLPPQLAALMQTNINVQALTVEAALTCKREHIYHAAMLDPHTAAELSMDQITRMVDEMIDVHGRLLPNYR